MAINLDYPPSATPLDPDEVAGLIPSHIANRGQLNEWEMVNILEGERWAGKFRTTEKNIGVDPARIQTYLRDLCEDVKAQLGHESYPLDEIAARFSHRLVAIHPYANGNGRLSRTLADLLLVQHGAPRFTWGAGNLLADGEVRHTLSRRLARGRRKRLRSAAGVRALMMLRHLQGVLNIATFEANLRTK